MTTFPLTDRDARPPRLARRASARRKALTRLRVAIRHSELDAALARGADPRGRAELALRAVQLERMRHRRVLARTLRRVVAEAHAAPSVGRPQPIALQRAAVRADAADLLALAERLAFPQPPASVAGVAIAQRLVTDGLTSPLYAACEPHTLRRLTRHALSEIGPID